MSHRSIESKKRRRVVRELEQQDLPSYINLIDYIKFRTRCSTSTAEKVLLLGALTVDGHTVGYYTAQRLDGSPKKVLHPYLPADLRDKIVIRKMTTDEEEEYGVEDAND